jgi:hypothetical protein
MVRDEAPAATTGGFNGETECDRSEIGLAARAIASFLKRSDQPHCCGTSISDESQHASATAGCIATFKLCAMPPRLKTREKSMNYCVDRNSDG